MAGELYDDLDELAVLDGQGVVAAFRSFVLWADSVQEAGEKAISAGVNQYDVRQILELGNPEWEKIYRWALGPVDQVRIQNKAQRLISFESNERKKELWPFAAKLISEIYEQFDQFTSALGKGHLEAYEADTGNNIPREIWCAGGYWLDVLNGEIGRGGGDVPIEICYKSSTLRVQASVAIDLVEMSGPIGEVYRRVVLNSPDVLRCHLEAIAKSKGFSLPQLDGSRFGMSSSEHHTYWPAASGKEFRIWETPCAPPGQPGSKGFEHIKRFYRTLSVRHTEFFNLLISGSVRATGEREAGGAGEVPSGLWTDSDIRFHAVSNRIGRKVLSEDGLNVIVLWRGVNLEPTEGKGTKDHILEESGSKEPGNSLKSKTGRNPKYAWEEAFKEVVLMLGRYGHPETGSALADMYLTAFEKLRGEVPNKGQVEKHLRENYQWLWDHVKKKSD